MILFSSNSVITDRSSLGAPTAVTSKNTNASSTDLAKVSTTPSVNVQLSSSQGELASAVASIPPIYNKPTVNQANTLQLSPSRNSSSVDALASDALTGKASGNQDSDNEDEVKDKSADAKTDASGVELSEAELKVIEELKARDFEVRAHEQAHKAVGGQYTGAISYSYQSGPDGKRYAVGGEVPIDVSPVAGDPQATIAKMTVVRSAATAPAEPSAQDQVVAAQAARLLSQAQAELAEQKISELSGDDPESKDSGDKKQPNASESYIDDSIVAFQSVAQIDQEQVAVVDALV